METQPDLKTIKQSDVKSKFLLICLLPAFLPTMGCRQKPAAPPAEKENGKIVIYQVFTRLFGNTCSTNKPWGTLEENGTGKFDDFTDKALQEIKALGVTHIWYTGVLHHALVTGYNAFGIEGDDPDVVKGRAGSPYAVRDYYNVNPDLATDPLNRLGEFGALIGRTHRNGLKVLMDIVPNHVARHYQSLGAPEGAEDFGARDNRSVEYHKDNNFYYIPGKPFLVPEPVGGYRPLGGDPHPLSDGRFDEFPAKWTGNGSRSPRPGFYDWYETVKINFGVRPDGTKDFDTLPPGFDRETAAVHFNFWKDREVPGTWRKFRDIALFWLGMGVDGFRFDMAEMVPVEFWSYLNSAIKQQYPGALLLAEVYTPTLYRDYIRLGKMDYLYDKVGLYDTLKLIIRGQGSAGALVRVAGELADIEPHMLHFLENHDEQRIASPEFAGDPRKAKPAMVLSATLGTGPTLVYFGQEVGEPGAEKAGFGSTSRTSIFDYIGVPAHQRWMNGGKFDGGLLMPEEKELRDFYARLLRFTVSSTALTGAYRELHTFNRSRTPGYSDRVFAFARWKGADRLLILCNFDPVAEQTFDLQIPEELIHSWNLPDGVCRLEEQLYGGRHKMTVAGAAGNMSVRLKPLESLICRIN